MLELAPGTHVQVRAALVEAARATNDVIGAMTATDIVNAYFLWAANQVRALRHAISHADLDRLITTHRYWAMYGGSGMDLGAAGSTTIQDEMLARMAALEGEIVALDRDLATWGNGRALAVIPDTSVFVEHGGAFPELPWHEMLNQRSNVPIHVVVTMAVVRELDGKKLSRDNSSQGVSVRNGVQAALRRIEELFPWNEQQQRFDEDLRRVDTTLLTDDLGHIPLPDPDGEMIRRGLAVMPYSGSATLVTYDLSQTFRARAAGLGAHRLRYGYEVQQ
jgi:hypothetical protein